MKLTLLKDGNFELADSTWTMEGSLGFLIAFMHEDLGVSVDEIDFALETMNKTGLDVAVFSDTIARLNALGTGGVSKYTFVHCEPAVRVSCIRAELDAIQELRATLQRIHSEQPDSPVEFETMQTLQRLYSTLNVNELIKLLDEVRTRDVA